jgi:hypothetical protein
MNINYFKWWRAYENDNETIHVVHSRAVIPQENATSIS